MLRARVSLIIIGIWHYSALSLVVYKKCSESSVATDHLSPQYQKVHEPGKVVCIRIVMDLSLDGEFSVVCMEAQKKKKATRNVMGRIAELSRNWPGQQIYVWARFRSLTRIGLGAKQPSQLGCAYLSEPEY